MHSICEWDKLILWKWNSSFCQHFVIVVFEWQVFRWFARNLCLMKPIGKWSCEKQKKNRKNEHAVLIYSSFSIALKIVPLSFKLTKTPCHIWLPFVSAIQCFRDTALPSFNLYLHFLSPFSLKFRIHFMRNINIFCIIIMCLPKNEPNDKQKLCCLFIKIRRFQLTWKRIFWNIYSN